MSEFPLVPLGEVAAVRSGYAFKSSDWKADGTPVVKIANVKSGRLNMVGCSYVDADIAHDASEFSLTEGDILIAMTGYIGEVAVVRQCDIPALLNQRVGRFSITDGKRLDKRYLYFWVSSREVRAEIEGLGYGSAQPNVSPTLIHGVRLSLPPLSIQHAIASFLGAFDDKIDLNRRMNETLETMARAIFKDWFVDFGPTRAKMEKRAPYLSPDVWALFPDRLNDDDKPDGWGIGELKDISEIMSGKRPTTRFDQPLPEASIPLWGGNGPMGYVESPLHRGPILLTGRVGTLGSVFRITEPCWPSDNTLVLEPVPDVPISYLYFQLKLIDFQSLNRGSTQPLLTQTDLKSQVVLLPSNLVLAAFGPISATLFDRLDACQRETDQLAATRDLLLPKLMSGEIRIKDAEKMVETVL